MRLEAFFWLIAAWFIRQFIPFRIWTKWFGTLGFETDATPFSPAQTEEVQHVSDAVNRGFLILPSLNNCLLKSMAAKIMLQRRGLPSTLYLGVMAFSNRQNMKGLSHAWVRCGVIEVVWTWDFYVKILAIGNEW